MGYVIGRHDDDHCYSGTRACSTTCRRHPFPHKDLMDSSIALYLYKYAKAVGGTLVGMESRLITHIQISSLIGTIPAISGPIEPRWLFQSLQLLDVSEAFDGARKLDIFKKRQRIYRREITAKVRICQYAAQHVKLQYMAKRFNISRHMSSVSIAT